MSFLPQVIGARHISGFIVSARFDDGSAKYIDVSQRFKGPFLDGANAETASLILSV